MNEILQPEKKRSPGRPRKSDVAHQEPVLLETKRKKKGPKPSDPLSLSRRIGDDKCIANLQSLTLEQLLEVYYNIKRMYNALLPYVKDKRKAEIARLQRQIDLLKDD